jgi:hypothetical protein
LLGQIEAFSNAGNERTVARLVERFEQFEDERCQRCGKFFHDPADSHAWYCELAFSDFEWQDETA